MENPARRVPLQILNEAIKSTKGIADPRGSDALMHYTTMFKNSSQYNLEVLYNEESNTIYHFEYARKSMGPLIEIFKRKWGNKMNSKEKLYYLLCEFLTGNYDANSFCDQFTVEYDIETDYEELSELENTVFGKLCMVTSRYSSFEEDLKIPNVYANEQEVKDKAIETYNLLK